MSASASIDAEAGETGRSPRPRRGPCFWFGVACVTVGLAVIGWFCWQFFGTNIVSEHRHREVVDRLEEDWRSGFDQSTTPWGEAIGIVRIPRFGADYEVPVYEGTTEEIFASGFGHFTDSATIGSSGNAAIGAHRVTNGEPLRRMPELVAGDEVSIETRERLVTYEVVSNDLTVPFSEDWPVRDPLEPPNGPGTDGAPRERSVLTLVTCSSLFHTDYRSVAFARLVSIEVKAPPGRVRAVAR